MGIFDCEGISEDTLEEGEREERKSGVYGLESSREVSCPRLDEGWTECCNIMFQGGKYVIKVDEKKS